MTATYLKLLRTSETVAGAGRHQRRRAETRDDDVSRCRSGKHSTQGKEIFFMKKNINKCIFHPQGFFFCAVTVGEKDVEFNPRGGVWYDVFNQISKSRLKAT